MNIRNLIENSPLCSKVKHHFKFDEALAPYTSFKIGGKAEVLYIPENVAELQTLCDFFIKAGIKLSIIGNASNLLISDEGIKGIVIHIADFALPCIIKKEKDDIFVHVRAGTLVETLLQFCIDNEISGLEDFGGLPASIGGATFMNAKCFDTSISDVLVSAEIMTISEHGASLGQYKMQQKDWGYKSSPFQKCTSGISIQAGRNLILSCIFRLKKGKKEEIKAKIEEKKSLRISKRQFDFPSAGSVFKNDYTIGIPTGKLVSDAGLLGLQCGAAQVAEWHGNFIINRGGASSKDVLRLMEQVKEAIKKQYGILLESEVIYCK